MRYFLRFVLFCTCLTLCNIPHSRAAVDFHPEKPTIEEQGKWSSALERWQHKWMSKVQKVVSKIDFKKARRQNDDKSFSLGRLSMIVTLSGFVIGVLIPILSGVALEAGIAFFLIGLAIGLVGAIMGLIALVRKDPHPWEAWIGLIVGALPHLILFIFFLVFGLFG
jgi:VIT1/CCC1 family predicted Fe2+/Mn2+ transporter